MNPIQQALSSFKGLFGGQPQAPPVPQTPPPAPMNPGYGQILNNFATGVQQRFGNFMQNTNTSFWRGPIGQGLVGTQKLIEDPNSPLTHPFPTIPTGQNDNLVVQMGKGLLNMPSDIGNSIVGQGMIAPSLDVIQNAGKALGMKWGTQQNLTPYEQLHAPISRLGYQIAGAYSPQATQALGIKNGLQQTVGNVAGAAMPFVNTALLGGGADLATGKNLLEQGGKVGFADAVKEGIINGGKYGALFGGLTGLEQNRNTQNLGQYALNVAGTTAGSALMGVAFGAALSGSGYAAQQLIGGLARVRMAKDPNVTPQQAMVDANGFVHDELGRFSGFQSNKKEPQFYGDLRESLGMPRNGITNKDIPMGLSVKPLTEEEHNANVASGILGKNDDTKNTVTLYRASPELQTSGTFGKGTYFADTPQKASYYSESHLQPGQTPQDIKVEKFVLPKDAVFKEPSTGNYRLTSEAPVNVAQQPSLPEVTPPEPMIKPTASDFEAEMNAQVGKINPEDITKLVEEHGRAKENYKASLPNLDTTQNEMARGTIGSAFDQGPMKKYFADWVNARKASPVEGMIQGNKFAGLDEKGMQGILDFQAGDKTGQFADLKNYFDQRYKQAKGSGLDFNYKQDYLPQLWANSPQEVKAVFDRNLGKNPSFTMDSVFKSYKDGIDAGLTPRFTKVSDLVKWYESTYTKNLADRNFFQQLIKDGQIASPSKAPPGWVTLDPDRFPKFKVNVPEGTYQGAYKAPPELADMINNYLKAPQFKFLNDIANFTSTAKNRALSFGVPTTAINMHGVNIMARDVLFGSSGNPITRFLTSARYMVNPNSAEEMVNENLTKAPFAIKSGLTFGVEDHSGLGESPGVLSKFGNSWNNLFEKPLFNKMIPALKLQNFYSVFEDYKKSMPEEQAAKEAARITNNVYGGFNWEELGKSRDMQNLKRAIILAPDWLESNLRLGGNIAKSLANPTNPAGKAYRAAATNLVGAYVLANVANKISSGHYMFQNDPGHTFEIQTGFTTDGQKRYFRPFGTAVDFVRIPYDIALGLAKGDPTTAFRAIGNRMSIPLGAISGLISNTDYLGNPIYGHGMSPKQSLMGTAGQLVGLAGIPSFAKNAIDVASGKTGVEQGLTQGLELPFRYSGGAATKKIVTQMKGQGASDSAINDKLKQMTNSAQAKQNVLSGIDPKVQNALTVADSLSAPTGDVGQDLSNKYARANLYLGNPSLLAAKTAIAQAQAQANGTDLNPLYALTPDQQKIVLRYESLQPGTDKSAYYKNNIQLLQPYYNTENQYYAKNPIQNPNTTAPKAPVASARAQALMNAGNFRDPEVQAYLQQNTAYKNYQREALGLGPLASTSSGGRAGGMSSFQRSMIKRSLAPKKVHIGIKKVSLTKGFPKLQARGSTSLGKGMRVAKFKTPTNRIAKLNNIKPKGMKLAKSAPKFRLAKSKKFSFKPLA